VIDICKGNHEPPKARTRDDLINNALEEAMAKIKGNFAMSKKPTNPINYFQGLGIDSIFRFILTHPDMDHLDGFDALVRKFSVANFWDSGVRRTPPDFENCIEYKKEDWDRYVSIRDKKEGGITVLSHLAGSRFKFANQNDAGEGGGDGLYILAPNTELVEAANQGGDINDGSYVLLYRSAGGRILIPGDAHDETWDYVIENYADDVKDCSVLFAPHHGRKSGRSFDFLDVVNPKLTFFGCASSGDLAYQAWAQRGLRVITNNQAGNIVLDSDSEGIKVYVQNDKFAEASGCDMANRNSQGYVFLESIEEKSVEVGI
jgi:beta-lactamase superfamily II metal-dependent hydrolase